MASRVPLAAKVIVGAATAVLTIYLTVALKRLMPWQDLVRFYGIIVGVLLLEGLSRLVLRRRFPASSGRLHIDVLIDAISMLLLGIACYFIAIHITP